MIESIMAAMIVAFALVFVAFVLVVVEQRNANRWRILMARLYATPTRLDHAVFDVAFVDAVADQLAKRVEHDDLAGAIDAAVDASIGRRLPNAEQFEATVKAIVAAREAAQYNGGRRAEGRT